MPIGPPPYLPEPKSACMPLDGPMLLMIVLELRATGSLSTRWFQGLFPGKIVQPPTRGRPPPAASAIAATLTAAMTIRGRKRFLIRERLVADDLSMTRFPVLAALALA